MCEQNDDTVEINNTDYFESYGQLSVHELMLKDKPRTLAYMEAIQKNQHLFKDKIIMDVGAGTGILSIFAAKSGAKRVFAVEASNIAHTARKIISDNGLSDVITVLDERVEDIQELPFGVRQVDVIISEWMGFYLLHESMLNSVLFARDKWMSPNGTMFPSHANIYAAPCDMRELFNDTVGFWQDVYGVNMSAVIPDVVSNLLSKPYVGIVKQNRLLSKPVHIHSIDCNKISISDLQTLTNSSVYQVCKVGVLHGFCLWFDVIFSSTLGGETVVLHTGPDHPETHWKQTVILLPQSFDVSEEDAIPVTITMDSSQDNHRHYELSLEFGE
ncbi:protein arginine N-methyltransferase [Acrasis kona]|uniref:type I protein arginine methyltransferase n=1 Tax=Acrasis kona TaxID=1008807 RepID=A0AAW2YZ38_9EUKA